MIETNETTNPLTAFVNTDGGSRGNPGPAAWGFVLKSRDPQHEASGYLGIQTNNVAEYRALVEALKYARSKGIINLVVLSDSKLVVEQMNGRWAVKDATLRTLWAEATVLAEGFEYISYMHVRRNLNKEADRVVNECLDANEGK